MKKTKDELNIAKDDVNNYKQEVQYLIKSKSRKRTDQVKSIKDQRKKTP